MDVLPHSVPLLHLWWLLSVMSVSAVWSSAARWLTNCVTFYSGAHQTFNQTGSRSILSPPAPQHAVHQSMSCQYCRTTVPSVVLCERQCLPPLDREQLDEAFTAESYCLFSPRPETGLCELCETSQTQCEAWLFHFHRKKTLPSLVN